MYTSHPGGYQCATQCVYDQTSSCLAKTEQRYIPWLRHILIYKMFFLIQSGYIVLVCEDRNTNIVLELIMLIKYYTPVTHEYV